MVLPGCDHLPGAAVAQGTSIVPSRDGSLSSAFTHRRGRRFRRDPPATVVNAAPTVSPDLPTIEHHRRGRGRAWLGAVPRLSQFAVEHLLLLPLGALIAMVWVNVEPESYYRFTYSIAFAVNDVGMVLFFALMTKEVVEATVTGGVLHPWRRALAAGHCRDRRHDRSRAHPRPGRRHARRAGARDRLAGCAGDRSRGQLFRSQNHLPPACRGSVSAPPRHRLRRDRVRGAGGARQPHETFTSARALSS